MAQKDATEQAKEVLRQIIKYRFWISISVAALFALIAYFLGSGPVRAKADTAKSKIKKAESDVKLYALPTIPTKEYQPIVQEKTQVLSKDVNTAWKTLFDRQAPLLTWPETVQERFRKWGRKWPENTDPRKIETTIVDYIEAYPSYVSMVYKSFNPFDYETGEGLVVAPPEYALLRPAQFSIEHLPGLGKVWAAQERLWIQHTLLEVVAQVNKNAKTWDTAVIRQILSFEVGNPAAQDQRSIAKNETLEEAQSINAPGEEPTELAAAGSGADMAGAMGGGKYGGYGNRMGGMMGGGSGMGGGGIGTAQGSETVYYVKAAADKGQYKILPVVMTVLIDQDHVQDFLVELENSPMSIQVMDFELVRPTARVEKPEKGVGLAGGYGGGMGMMMGGANMQAQRMMQQMGGTGASAYGGRYSQMQNQMMQAMGRGNSGYDRMGRMGGMGTTPAQPQRTGKDVRGVDRGKQRVEKQKAVEQAKGPSFFDPYFDIVQVTIYGQARFFNPPPAEATSEPSPGETVAAPAAADTPGSPAGPAAAKVAPTQGPPGAAQPAQEAAAPKAADRATPDGADEAEAGKPAPKAAGGSAPTADDEAEAGKPAPKDGGATKAQPDGASARP